MNQSRTGPRCPCVQGRGRRIDAAGSRACARASPPGPRPRRPPVSASRRRTSAGTPAAPAPPAGSLPRVPRSLRRSSRRTTGCVGAGPRACARGRVSRYRGSRAAPPGSGPKADHENSGARIGEILVMSCIGSDRPTYGPFHEGPSRNPPTSRQNRYEFSRRVGGSRRRASKVRGRSSRGQGTSLGAVGRLAFVPRISSRHKAAWTGSVAAPRWSMVAEDLKLVGHTSLAYAGPAMRRRMASSGIAGCGWNCGQIGVAHQQARRQEREDANGAAGRGGGGRRGFDERQ